MKVLDRVKVTGVTSDSDLYLRQGTIVGYCYIDISSVIVLFDTPVLNIDGSIHCLAMSLSKSILTILE